VADYYSEHYAPQSTAAIVPLGAPSDPAIKAPPGISHIVRRTKRARLDMTATTIATNELVYAFSMKSGDRPYELGLSSLGFTATALTLHIGLYGSGGDIDVEIDENIFSDDVDCDNVARGAVDVLIDGVMDDIDRGQPLWFIANEGGGTYTEDPKELWHVVLSFNTVTAVTVNGIIQLEMEYVAAAGN
jgi:hypothetical protein